MLSLREAVLGDPNEVAGSERNRPGFINLKPCGLMADIVMASGMARPLGNYKSYELIETKGIGQTSRTVYLSMIFERGIVYARFLVCRADKDWVVQDMDFNTKPEAIMPWLTFERNK